MVAGTLRRFAATADVNAGSTVIAYGGWTVSPGTATTTITLRSGGSGGPIIWAGVFAANASAVCYPLPFLAAGLHVTVAGAAAEVSILG